MNLNQYQTEAFTFAQYPHEIAEMYISIAIMGEAGEVSNVYKKELRSGVVQTDKMRDELGDLWWYLAALCSEYSEPLEKLYSSVIQRAGLREPKYLQEHLRDLVKEALDMACYQQEWSQIHGDKSIFMFAKDVLREVLWIQWYYQLSNDEVLEYNLQKLYKRAESGTIKNHE